MKFILVLFLVVFCALAYAAAPDHCSLPANPGVGRAAKTKYFYNSASGECESFIWGGVERGSNGNKFETKELCESECKV